MDVAMTVKNLLAQSAFPILLLGAAAAMADQAMPPVKSAATKRLISTVNSPKGSIVSPTSNADLRCTAAIREACISTSAGMDIKLLARAKKIMNHGDEAR